MAIGYTPRTWVNGSSPALNATNLQAMDDGINAACDALDAMAADGTGVADATTEVKGRVMLATTGVEAATKVPKATGAEIAALLTAGGYTLTAPSGSNSLDGIADTATWKKVAAAVATALNADTYTANDADKVSAYGVGTNVMVDYSGNIDTTEIGGLYRTVAATTGTFPTGASSQFGSLVVLPFQTAAGALYWTQIWLEYNTNRVWIRKSAGSVGSWYEIFNASTDGNGGQPPEVKSRDTTDNLIGQSRRFASIDGAALVLPIGGQWIVFYVGSVKTSNGVILYNAWHHSDSTNILAGGTTLAGATPDTTHYAIIKRLSV